MLKMDMDQMMMSSCFWRSFNTNVNFSVFVYKTDSVNISVHLDTNLSPEGHSPVRSLPALVCSCEFILCMYMYANGNLIIY